MLPKEAKERSGLRSAILVFYNREEAGFERKEAWGDVLSKLGAIAIPLDEGLVELQPSAVGRFRGAQEVYKVLERHGFERVIDS